MKVLNAFVLTSSCYARSVLSVVAAFVTGVVYLIPLNFVLTRIPDLLAVASLQPMPLLFKYVVGSAGGAFGLLFLILGIWLFAAIGSLTAASRCTWSFSRDGGIPGSGMWKKVNKRFGLPVNALILSTIVDALLGLIYLGSSAAFNAFTGGKQDVQERKDQVPLSNRPPSRDSRYHLSRRVLYVPNLVQRPQETRDGQGRTVLAGSIWLCYRGSFARKLRELFMD